MYLALSFLSFFFFLNNSSCLIWVSLYVVNYFLCMSFFPFFPPGTSSAIFFLCSLSVLSSKVHACGDHWHNFIISVAIFEDWVIAPCIYVPHFFKILSVSGLFLGSWRYHYSESWGACVILFLFLFFSACVILNGGFSKCRPRCGY